MKRRNFIIKILIMAPFLLFGALARSWPFQWLRQKIPFRYVRPPGAGSEESFLDKCIRCRECANVCDAGCIRFFGADDDIFMAGTPYLNTRLKSCNLCMNCTQVCPTGALSAITRDIEEIKKNVSMGKAKVIESNCLSFNGRICGICIDACPLGGEAIVLMTKARPKVIEDVCIGCGRCEERCPQSPAAIIVYQDAV